MSDINKLLDNYKETKSFSQTNVDDSTIDSVLKLSQCAMSFSGGLNTSILVIKDKMRKQEIADALEVSIMKEAPVLLLFLLDSYKAERYKEQYETKKNSDSTFTSTLIEIGANLSIVNLALENLGLGSFNVNLLHKDLTHIITILDLPHKTLPVFAVCLGYPSDVVSKKRPKVPLPIYKHEEKYNIDKIDSYLNDFNEIQKEYLKLKNYQKQEFETLNADNINNNLQKQKITFNK